MSWDNTGLSAIVFFLSGLLQVFFFSSLASWDNTALSAIVFFLSGLLQV
jgi:hypothetical protein